MTFITNILFKFIANIFKIQIMTKLTLFWSTCFISINSFWNIDPFELQRFYNSYKHSPKKMCRYFPFSSKTDLIIVVIAWTFNRLFNGKSSFELNLIFIKSFLHSPDLPPFIVLIKYLILSQSSVYFFNTSLFSSLEAKLSIYILPFFSSMCPSVVLTITCKGFAL